jgi:anaerobic dimethyl sulfoxide reductase subunit B (iron-sulfur subunit)
MTQYGFFFDQSRCSGCRACTVACKSWNGLPAGSLKYLKIYEYEKGSFPDVRVHFQWIPCYHCEDAVCISSCPSDAIYKEEKYGAVIIDSEKCSGCRLCYDACPYGAPVFESDNKNAKAQKCTMCIDRLENGDKPICVSACQSRALDFGQLDELVSKYGDRRDLEDMPNSRTTKPAVVFKPHAAKRQLVPYDSKKALKLLMKRDPLPKVYGTLEEASEAPEGMIGRNRLVVKHKSIDELMHYTRNDEG